MEPGECDLGYLERERERGKEAAAETERASESPGRESREEGKKSKKTKADAAHRGLSFRRALSFAVFARFLLLFFPAAETPGSRRGAARA